MGMAYSLSGLCSASASPNSAILYGFLLCCADSYNTDSVYISTILALLARVSHAAASLSSLGLGECAN